MSNELRIQTPIWDYGIMGSTLYLANINMTTNKIHWFTNYGCRSKFFQTLDFHYQLLLSCENFMAMYIYTQKSYHRRVRRKGPSSMLVN